ncbi:MAG: 16S rRNA (uracil(1498)-N(3))-methyltransferase [Rhodanobacter sp.]
MRTIRIHVDSPLSIGTEVSLLGQAAEHVARVLRLAPGDAVTLFNGDGRNYPSLVLAAKKREVSVQIESEQPANNESPLALTLAQGIARGEKMDWIVQKATELGVVRIVPLLTERAEVRLDAERAQKRLARWRSVAISACEQSGRACVPQIEPALALEAWLEQLDGECGLRLSLLPQAQKSIRALHFATPRGVLVTGPEGGLGEQDIRALRTANFSDVSLGPRILRTETAGLAALAALQAVHGDG